MNTDIKFDQDIITLEGFRITARSADFCLDFPDRRSGTNPALLRRAMVHDTNDGLTLNFGGDYPAGVYIQGKVTMEGNTTFQHDASIQGNANVMGNVAIEGLVDVRRTITALRIDVKDIKIDSKQFSHIDPKTGAIYSRTAVDLGVIIGNLQSQVSLLEEKVRALEAK